MNETFIKYFRVSFLFLLAFVIFHAFNQSNESEVIIIENGKNKEEMIDQLLSEGFIRKDLSYYFLKLSLAFSGDVEEGGYELKRGLGAVSAALELGEPEYKFVYVDPGERKGEIADHIADQLDWDESKRKSFAIQFPVCELIGQEGFLANGKYLIHKDEDPEIVKLKMEESFRKKLDELKIEDSDLVTIASLIQREAAGKNDMRLISGIIHNRLKKGMPLQIDATLQYIKGEEGNWWPVPKADDKYIDSLYNTYQIEGTPPAPISTVSENALYAAANPISTDCLYYLHDKWGNIHCSTNYERHKEKVSWYLR